MSKMCFLTYLERRLMSVDLDGVMTGHSNVDHVFFNESDFVA